MPVQILIAAKDLVYQIATAQGSETEAHQHHQREHHRE
jgi:hypothetical protein